MFLYMYHHIADELIYHSVMSVYSIWQQYSMYIAYILHNIDHQGKNVDNVYIYHALIEIFYSAISLFIKATFYLLKVIHHVHN